MLDTCEQGTEVVDGDRFVRKVRLWQAGQVVGGHAHNYDHVTEFKRGRVSVVVDGAPATVYGPGDSLDVPADAIHELTALDEDGAEFWCVFEHRDAAGNVVTTYQGDPSRAPSDEAYQCR